MNQAWILATTVVALIATCTSSIALAADESKSKSFPVPGHGDLQLTIPDGWKVSIEPAPQPGLPAALQFTTDGKKFTVLVSVVPAPRGARGFTAPDRLRKIAEAQGQQMLPTAREQAIAIEEIKGTDATGYFFTLTDKAPAPGSFEYVTSGFVGVGDLLLTVTILYHEKDAPERLSALNMLKSASVKVGAVAAPGADLRIAAPGGGWELVIPGKGLEVLEDKTDPTRKMRQLTAADKESGLVVSVFMEPARKAGDAKIVRDVYWGRAKTSPLKKEGIKLDSAGDFATVQYIVPDVEGVKLNQKNVNLYAAHEGVWVDVHLSKTEFTDKDQEAIDQIVRGVKVVKAPAERR